jgi:hypothetical protein
MLRTRHTRIGIALLTALALGALPAAAESALERESQDRAQIEKLMWQYARALDTLNPDAYAATYTPDGEFRAGASVTKGHDALKKMIRDLKQRNVENETKSGKKSPAMYHTSLNHYLEFIDKDHARLRAYYMTAFAAEGQGAAPRVAAVGWESNDLVRVNGQWLVKVRDVAPKE